MERLHTKLRLADTLTDVTIREGSQQAIDLRNASVDTKLELLDHTISIGVRRIELTAFAPGPWFSDSSELIQGANSRVTDNIKLRALYFNTKGLVDLLKHSPVTREGIFHTAATSDYREKNYQQRSPDHALVKMGRLIDSFKTYGLQFDTLMVSTAWGDRGELSDAERTTDYLARLLASAKAKGFPVKSVTLADTAGYAGPDAVKSLIERVKKFYPEILVRVHLHPDPKAAEDCIHAALEGGAEQWEASWCGLGGSPFASKPGGNLDIRHLIKIFNKRHFAHGFSEEAVGRIVHFLKKHTQRNIPDIKF